MSLLILVLIVLVITGLALYAVDQFSGIDGRMAGIIKVVIILIAIVFLVQRAGLLG